MTKAHAVKKPGRSRPAQDAPIVACFGEVLWDCLPRGLFLGGAPMNAAYHLAQQGLRVLPVTAVGRDFLGNEAERRMAAWGVEMRGIARATRPTGTVIAHLNAVGVPSYTIAEQVAWDRITVSHELKRMRPAPAALVYGTLALRETANRRILTQLHEAWPHALRVLDLNLRAPFDQSDAVAFALALAQLVKLNDEELDRLVGLHGRESPALARAAEQFASRFKIDRVCVTAGARGAGLWWRGDWYWEKARPVRVRDTVGAGDAFLGGLLGALLLHAAKPRSALRAACRLGEFVASQDGATPAYRLDERGRPVAV